VRLAPNTHLEILCLASKTCRRVVRLAPNTHWEVVRPEHNSRQEVVRLAPITCKEVMALAPNTCWEVVGLRSEDDMSSLAFSRHATWFCGVLWERDFNLITFDATEKYQITHKALNL